MPLLTFPHRHHAVAITPRQSSTVANEASGELLQCLLELEHRYSPKVAAVPMAHTMTLLCGPRQAMTDQGAVMTSSSLPSLQSQEFMYTLLVLIQYLEMIHMHCSLCKVEHPHRSGCSMDLPHAARVVDGMVARRHWTAWWGRGNG